MSSTDDDMRDRHALPPREGRHRRNDAAINLLPIREKVAAFDIGDSCTDNDAHHFAGYASAVIPALCDEIVRLRALISDMQVTPA